MRVLTHDVDVDDGDDDDECKNRADRVKAGTSTSIYLRFQFYTLPILTRYSCCQFCILQTRKPDTFIFIKTIVPVIFMYPLYPDSKSKLFTHVIPFGKC